MTPAPSDPPVEFIELNILNYDHDQVCQLNEWAIWAISRIEYLEGTKCEDQST